MSKQLTDSCKTWGPLALRVVTGLIFVLAGYAKLQGIDGFATALAGVGYPIGLTLAWLVALTELVAGAMLVLGIQTRKAAIPLKVIIVFAVITKLFLGGFGGAAWNNVRYDLLLIAALSVLAGYGAGAWSLEKNSTKRITSTSTSKSAEKTPSKSASSAKKKPAKKASSKKKSSKSSKKKSSSKKKKSSKK